MEGHDRLLTVGEIATLFRADDKTVRRWIATGRLSAIITPGGQYRIRESDVRALLTGDRPGASASSPPLPSREASGPVPEQE